MQCAADAMVSVLASRHHDSSSDANELSAAIDTIFGSAEWINGRHYRNR